MAILVCDPERHSFMFPIDWFSDFPEEQIVRTNKVEELSQLIGDHFDGALLCVGPEFGWENHLTMDVLDRIKGPRFLSVPFGMESKGWDLVTKGLFHDVLSLPVSAVQLKKSWAKWQSYLDFFQRTNDAIFLVDPESEQTLEMNLVAEKYFGLNKQTLLEKNITWDKLLEEEKQKDARKVFRMSKRSYYARAFPDVQILHPEQKELWADFTMGLLNFQGRDVMQVTIRDITEKKIAEKKLEELSITDPLTGLNNRRHFEKVLEERFEEATRHGSPVSLIYIDIDKFKVFNDTNGHPAGDTLLKAVAKIIKDTASRKYTISARLGGEEFVIFLPRIDKAGAMIVAERLRSTIQNTKFEHGEKQPFGFVSISVGVAEYPSDCSTKEDLIRISDEALYFSKENGRNQVNAFPLPAKAKASGA